MEQNTHFIIGIRNKIPYKISGPDYIVTDNSDYTLELVPDEQWEGLEAKTVYYAFDLDGAIVHPIVGNHDAVPVMTKAGVVYIGVSAGDIRTTRPLTVKVASSIRDMAGVEIPEPEPEVYDRIMEIINDHEVRIKRLETGGTGGGGDGATDITLGITGAVVGKTVKITEVDEDGRPVKWEAADIPAKTDIDSTLSIKGSAADAKAVGDKVAKLSEAIADKVDRRTLQTAVDDALQEAKTSGVFDGAAGKSAYEYAQDGGYTGTEEEFAAKLAEEIPDALPNPNAITFTGAATGTYDGSKALTVEIPIGGGGSGGAVSWKLIRTINIVSGTSSYSFDTDNNGNTFKVKNFLILIDEYPSTTGYFEIKPNNNFSFVQQPRGKRSYPFSFMMKRLIDVRYILENSLTNNLTFERKISVEYSSFGEFTSFSFWFSDTPESDTTMYILGEDV